MEYDKNFGVKNITHTVNVISPYYINYYSEKLHQQSSFVQYSLTTEGALQQLDSIVQHCNTIYFLHGWSNTYDPPEAEQIIMQKFPFVADRNNYFNSAITLYSKELQDSKSETMKPLFELNHDFETLSWDTDSAFRTKDKAHNGLYAAHLDKDHEFSPTFRSSLNEINFKKGCTVQLSVWINTATIPLDANLVLSIDGENKNVLWRGANAKEFIKTKNSWQQLLLACKINDDFSGNEKVGVYVWNSGKSDFYMDDLQIRVMP